MTRDDVARWLDRYIEAWRTYDPEAIRALFSEDAEERSTPWGEPIRGADAIVQAWLENPDPVGTAEGSYTPFAVEGRRAVAVGTSKYLIEGETRVFHNSFLLEFDDDGACRSFTDIYIEEP